MQKYSSKTCTSLRKLQRQAKQWNFVGRNNLEVVNDL